jgi:cardiolipin synthase A/B
MPWWFWLLVIHVATWLAIPSVLLSTKRPASMLAWIGAIVALPVLGLLLYLAFGTDRLRRRRRQRRGESPRKEEGSAPRPVAGEAELAEREIDLVRTVARISGEAPTGIARLSVLATAGDYYGDLAGRIEAARHHVHFQTYVWREDDTGRRLREVLVAAARRGVKVRVLVDELGSFETPETFFRPLVEAGGEFSWFYTIHPRRNRYFLNLRNHRKVQVVDGSVAWVGGMNVGREYEGRDPEVGVWHDLQMRFEGGLVRGLQESFAEDWYFATQRRIEDREYFPDPDGPDALPAVLVASGPDSARKPFLLSVIALCGFARERIDLFTPYFVPVASLVHAMQVAAARGVRVRLMVSEKNDHRFLVHIGRSYYEELMDFGVEIYEYGEAVHHAKVVQADDRWLLLGSANLDARSIDLNFELNVLLRSEEAGARLAERHEKMFASSARVEFEEFRRRPRRQRLAEGLSRLWAPLL